MPNDNSAVAARSAARPPSSRFVPATWPQAMSIRHLRPCGLQSKSTRPLPEEFKFAWMIFIPKPVDDGFSMRGPPFSSQSSVRRPSSVAHRTASSPPFAESAPYFAAFVASSCRVSATDCAVSGETSTGGPSAVIFPPLVR